MNKERSCKMEVEVEVELVDIFPYLSHVECRGRDMLSQSGDNFPWSAERRDVSER